VFALRVVVADALLSIDTLTDFFLRSTSKAASIFSGNLPLPQYSSKFLKVILAPLLFVLESSLLSPLYLDRSHRWSNMSAMEGRSPGSLASRARIRSWEDRCVVGYSVVCGGVWCGVMWDGAKCGVRRCVLCGVMQRAY
jgi:hypothetical protein